MGSRAKPEPVKVKCSTHDLLSVIYLKDGEIRVDHRSAGISKDCSSKRVRVIQETETDLEGALAMMAALAGEEEGHG